MNNEYNLPATDEEQREHNGGLNFDETITLYKALKLTGKLEDTCKRLLNEARTHHSSKWRSQAIKLHARLCEADTILGPKMNKHLGQKDTFGPSMN
jgi:hypothetical protein